MRMDSSDLKSSQVGQIDGDLAVRGGRGPSVWNVGRLNEGVEAAGDSQLVRVWRASSSIAERRQQQPHDRPQLDPLSHCVSPSSVQTGRPASPDTLVAAL